MLGMISSHDIRLIHRSTDLVFPRSKWMAFIGEDDPCTPVTI